MIHAYTRICTHAAFSALGLLPLHISLADNTHKAMYNIHIITSRYYKGICHVPPPGEVQTSKYLHARHTKVTLLADISEVPMNRGDYWDTTGSEKEVSGHEGCKKCCHLL